MPLLDHFHPPLHGPRRWWAFLHSWTTFIAQQLNQEAMPPDYFAIPDISIGPKLDSFEIRIYQNQDGDKLRSVIGLVAPANKEHVESRRTFTAKFAAYLQHGVGVVIVDIVTSRTANLHQELFDVWDMSTLSDAWKSPTDLYAVAYRAMIAQKSPRMEVWAEPLELGSPLPVLPLWLTVDLCVPVRLEESYLATCQSLRISA